MIGGDRRNLTDGRVRRVDQIHALFFNKYETNTNAVGTFIMRVRAQLHEGTLAKFECRALMEYHVIIAGIEMPQAVTG